MIIIFIYEIIIVLEMKNKIIFLIILLKSTFNQYIYLKKIRNLITEEQKEKVCFNFNKYEIEKEYSSINEYIVSLKFKKVNQESFLTKLILNQKLKNLGKFFQENAIYIFFIILSILFLIGKNIIYLLLK